MLKEDTDWQQICIASSFLATMSGEAIANYECKLRCKKLSCLYFRNLYCADRIEHAIDCQKNARKGALRGFLDWRATGQSSSKVFTTAVFNCKEFLESGNSTDCEFPAVRLGDYFICRSCADG